MYSVRGPDRHVGAPRRVFVLAPTRDAAAERARGAGIRPDALEALAEGEWPQNAAVLVARAPEADARAPLTPLARRARRIALGLGLGIALTALLLVGAWFVSRAREHLDRRGPGLGAPPSSPAAPTPS
ncbi:MAG: hypothetical protein C0475_01650 [Planctomyces sp.]|nr:hypothetical protein [Planctomyces sp.]MBA4120107.1 hypothetical protein [Isosphaera sp.]